MFDKQWSGYTHSIFIATLSSQSLFYYVSRVYTTPLCHTNFCLFSTLSHSIELRRCSIFHAPSCAGQIIVCYDRQQHTIYSGILLVLVHHTSWIPRPSISFTNGSIPFSHCSDWSCLRVEFDWLPFWVRLECFSNFDASLF